jgi:GT2 family glycosyltransferase
MGVIKKTNIFLLNWNSSLDIEQSLENINKSLYKHYRIILIDNDSQANDKINLMQIYNKYKNDCDIHVVLNNKNYGYAGGNNQGYEYIQENQFDGNILILNPDVVIYNNTLKEMENALIDDVGAVMTRTLSSDNSLMYDYIKLNGFKQKWLTTTQNIIETDYVAGSCMLLKREVIDNIGLFDENFFMYWEEVDLSFRIKDVGFRLVSTTKTNITRQENSPERNINAVYYYIKNAFYIQSKYKYVRSIDFILFLFKAFAFQVIYGIKYGSLFRRINKFFNAIVIGVKI